MLKIFFSLLFTFVSFHLSAAEISLGKSKLDSSLESNAQNFVLTKIWFIGESGEVQMQLENASARVGAIINVIFHKTATWAETYSYSLSKPGELASELNLAPQELRKFLTEVSIMNSNVHVNIIPAIERQRDPKDMTLATSQGYYPDTINPEVLPQVKSMDPKDQFSHFYKNLNARELTLRSQCYSLFSKY